jgi:hypothetical protein
MVPAHATAFAGELVRRHRTGWIVVGAILLGQIALRLHGIVTGDPLVDDWGTGFAFAVLVPLSVAFYWILAVFSFGHDGSVGSRRSIFPQRLFTLPVTNAALAGWPMLFGAAAIALLWIFARAVAPWPGDMAETFPWVWPGLLAIVLLAWLQPVLWASYPLPGLRVVAGTLCLSAVQVASVLAIEFGASERFMIAMLAPNIPLAFFAARSAVAQARRGGEADWSGGFARVGRVPGRRGVTRRPFASPHAAQLWLEWKRYGHSLPALTAIVLPVELLLLWAARGAPALVFTILAIVALTPPFMASFTAVGVRKSGEGSDYGLPPFMATRPLSSAAMVGARLRMAVWSTAAAWVLVIVAAPAALVMSGTWEIVADRAQRFAAVVGAPRAIVFGALVLATLVLTTWRQTVQSLYIGLTGRTALIKGTAIAMLCLIVAIGPLLDWAWNSGLRGWFWVALYAGLATIVAARMVVAARIAIRLHRDRLLGDRSLVAGAALWLAMVVAVYGVLLWLFDTPYVPRFLLLMIATVTVPLVRLSAAPVALAWNRHR